MQQGKMLKDADGNVLISKGSTLRRWKEYFEELMKMENVKKMGGREGSASDQQEEGW